MRQAVQSLAVQGRAAIAGLSDRTFEIASYGELLSPEAEVIGVADHLAQEMPLLLEFARQGKLDLSKVITRVVPLDADAINGVLDELDRYGDQVTGCGCTVTASQPSPSGIRLHCWARRASPSRIGVGITRDETDLSDDYEVCLPMMSLCEVQRAAGVLESRLAGTILQRIVQADDLRLILEFYGQAAIHRVLSVLPAQVCPQSAYFRTCLRLLRFRRPLPSICAPIAAGPGLTGVQTSHHRPEDRHPHELSCRSL